MTDVVDQKLATDKMAKFLKWGMIIVAGVVVSPIIFLAIKGLVGIAIALAFIAGVTQLAPVFAKKLANYKMKLSVNEDTKNPIETLMNDYTDRAKKLEEQEANIVEFSTEVRNYDDQLHDFKKEYPDDAESYQAISDKMHEAYQDSLEQQTAARLALAAFQKEINKQKAIYKMALAADHVASLNKTTAQDAVNGIHQQNALDAVRSQLNHAFANLDASVQRRSDALALTKSPATAITSNVVSVVPQKQPALIEAQK